MWMPRLRTPVAKALPSLVVGNWKMWGPRSALPEIDAIATVARAHPEVQVALCLPATLIDVAVARAPDLMIGAQDCHAERDGAYRSEEHTSELQSLMRISSAVFCLKQQNILNPQSLIFYWSTTS